jgi:ATP-dependent DNA helicase RecQ
VKDVLCGAFGIESLRPGQAEAISAFDRGQDALVLLPTGSGKSLCYQAPAVRRARDGLGPTLVVSPLIALMDDQVRALGRRGVRAVARTRGSRTPSGTRPSGRWRARR